ncbi:MAG: signal peptide peptidase SppA [Flavobacteriaceae bacterium]|nr:signal peptide peptidase SppA [Flavobacteriaceae bacterium]
MKFLRNLLASILGSMIAFGILFVCFYLLLIISAAMIGSSDGGVTVRGNSILRISFTEPISDYVGSTDSDPFGGLFEEGQGLDDILHALKVAKSDSRIEGISIETSYLLAGIAQSQEIRRALQDFKDTGKFVYAYSDFYSQKDYYVASVADEVYLNPQGVLDFKGLATEVLYYKDLQEKTGVKMEVVRHGKYKSAVEPFLANEMSAENRSQIKELIGSVWQSMLEDIAGDRELTVDELNRIADTLGGRTPDLAVASGLIDQVGYFDEYEAHLRETMGQSEDSKLTYIGLSDYVTAAKNRGRRSGKDKIAVIYAQGEIYYGEGDRQYIGQGMMVRALKKARDNDNTKAVVLRVNSPGGSSLTSDIIWREVALTAEVKPVVVSFGNVAASGGYYIAVGADKIFAEPTTITGSIGVFGTIPNISELAGNIGVNAEQVGTNENSIDYSVFEPMTDRFREQILEGIEQTYDTFLERVADGRNMTKEEVNEIAQGRVWSGVEAQQLGLVDELGNLDDAIEAAAELAELGDYGIRKYPRYRSDFEKLMDDLGGAKAKIGSDLIKEEIGEETYETLKQLKTMTERKGIQARMPFVLNIK